VGSESLNPEPREGGQIPLSLAIDYGNHEAIKLLRPLTNPKLKDSKGKTIEESLKEYDRSQNGSSQQERSLVALSNKSFLHHSPRRSMRRK